MYIIIRNLVLHANKPSLTLRCLSLGRQRIKFHLARVLHTLQVFLIVLGDIALLAIFLEDKERDDLLVGAILIEGDYHFAIGDENRLGGSIFHQFYYKSTLFLTFGINSLQFVNSLKNLKLDII